MLEIEKTKLIKKFNAEILSITNNDLDEKTKLWLISMFPEILDETFPKPKTLSEIFRSKKNGTNNE